MTQTHNPGASQGTDDATGAGREPGSVESTNEPQAPEAAATRPQDTQQLPTADTAEQYPAPPSPIWYGDSVESSAYPHGYAAPAAAAPTAPTASAVGSAGQGQAPTQPPAPTQETPTFGAAFGVPAAPGSAYGTTSGSPAGPLPPANPWATAEPAQPAHRRRWWELPAVAVLAAVLASGGTYAATQLGSDQAQTSSTASSDTSLGRGTDVGPVSQADASAPNWTATAAAVAPSVVSIDVKSQSAEGQGSGVVIDDQGHILTNNHVATGAGSGAEITVTLNDGRTYAATIAGTDQSTDLAVLTLTDPPSDLTPIALGDSEAIKVGDPVMAVGNPLGLSGTVTTGIVSALNRPVTTAAEETETQDQQQQDPFGGANPFGQGQQGETQQPQTSGDGPVVTNAIQTSAAINPGNSGGALVNASGQLIGINSSIASLGSSSSSSQSGSIGIGFAIPVNEAKSIASQLIDKGSADHALLGVTSQDGTAKDGDAERSGAAVVSVVEGSPAATAGLQKGDVVIAIDDEAVSSSESLVAHVRERAVGDQVTLTVLRDGKQVDLSTTLSAKATTTN